MAGVAPGEVLDHAIPLLEDREEQAGRPTAYVCEGYACRAPVNDPDALTELLQTRIGYRS